MSEYYYSKLTHREKWYYQRIFETIKQGGSTVKFSSFINKETITKVANAINYDHPELFFVDFRHLSFMSNSVNMIYQINYIVKSSLRQVIIDEIEQKIKNIIDMAYTENVKSDYEKCRWIHNYLVKNIRYNYAALSQPDRYPDSFGICGVFKNKLAVCEGISKSFKLLCDRMGVDTLVAFGAASLETAGIEIAHAWNIVRLEGEYSHIDVTWDINISELSKYTRFDYFCISDRYMAIDHVYKELPECAMDKLSYFIKWKKCFVNSRQLQEYLEAELKKGTSVLYFRAEKKNMDVKTLKKKIQEQVNKAVSSYYNDSYYIETIINEKQLCFFFRIRCDRR